MRIFQQPLKSHGGHAAAFAEQCTPETPVLFNSVLHRDGSLPDKEPNQAVRQSEHGSYSRPACQLGIMFKWHTLLTTMMDISRAQL